MLTSCRKSLTSEPSLQICVFFCCCCCFWHFNLFVLFVMFFFFHYFPLLRFPLLLLLLSPFFFSMAAFFFLHCAVVSLFFFLSCQECLFLFPCLTVIYIYIYTYIHMSTRQSCSCVLFFLSSFLDVFFFLFPYYRSFACCFSSSSLLRSALGMCCGLKGKSAVKMNRCGRCSCWGFWPLPPGWERGRGCLVQLRMKSCSS